MISLHRTSLHAIRRTAVTASLLLLTALWTGCASSRGGDPAARSEPAYKAAVSTAQETGRESSISAAEGPPHVQIESALRREVDLWLGTPHVLGGTTASGMDCSAFVQRVFADAFSVSLPRTTEAQVDVGQAVDHSELRPGDLVFFKPPTKTNHVGVYLSDGQFAHVSSTQGVTISPLDIAYWRTAYWTSRRVLEGTEPAHLAEERRPRPVQVEEVSIEAPRTSTPAPASPRRSRRIGW